MKLALKSIALLSFLILGLSIASALPLPPPNPCNDPLGECDPSTVPFDGGVSLILAAGAGIGAYKLRKKSKNQE